MSIWKRIAKWFKTPTGTKTTKSNKTSKNKKTAIKTTSSVQKAYRKQAEDKANKRKELDSAYSVKKLDSSGSSSQYSVSGNSSNTNKTIQKAQTKANNKHKKELAKALSDKSEKEIQKKQKATGLAVDSGKVKSSNATSANSNKDSKWMRVAKKALNTDSTKEVQLQQKIGLNPDLKVADIKYTNKTHPIASAAVRGAVKGASLGLSDTIEKHGDKKITNALKNVEKNYTTGQKVASTVGKVGGEMYNYLLSGALAGATGAKVASEIKPVGTAIDKLAGSSVVKSIAKKTGVEAADLSAKVAKGLATDLGVNLTTGNVQSVISAMNEGGSLGDKVKNYVENQAANMVLGAGIELAPAAKIGAKAMAKEGKEVAEKAAKATKNAISDYVAESQKLRVVPKELVDTLDYSTKENREASVETLSDYLADTIEPEIKKLEQTGTNPERLASLKSDKESITNMAKSLTNPEAQAYLYEKDAVDGWVDQDGVIHSENRNNYEVENAPYGRKKFKTSDGREGHYYKKDGTSYGITNVKGNNKSGFTNTRNVFRVENLDDGTFVDKYFTTKADAEAYIDNPKGFTERMEARYKELKQAYEENKNLKYPDYNGTRSKEDFNRRKYSTAMQVNGEMKDIERMGFAPEDDSLSEVKQAMEGFPTPKAEAEKAVPPTTQETERLADAEANRNGFNVNNPDKAIKVNEPDMQALPKKTQQLRREAEELQGLPAREDAPTSREFINKKAQELKAHYNDDPEKATSEYILTAYKQAGSDDERAMVKYIEDNQLATYDKTHMSDVTREMKNFTNEPSKATSFMQQVKMVNATGMNQKYMHEKAYALLELYKPYIKTNKQIAQDCVDLTVFLKENSSQAGTILNIQRIFAMMNPESRVNLIKKDMAYRISKNAKLRRTLRASSGEQLSKDPEERLSQIEGLIDDMINEHGGLENVKSLEDYAKVETETATKEAVEDVATEAKAELPKAEAKAELPKTKAQKEADYASVEENFPGVSETVDKEKYVDAAKAIDKAKKEVNPASTDKDAEGIFADAVRRLADPTLSQEEADECYADALMAGMKLVPMTLTEYFRELRYVSMLSAPRTYLKARAENFTNTVAHSISDSIAAFSETLLKKNNKVSDDYLYSHGGINGKAWVQAHLKDGSDKLDDIGKIAHESLDDSVIKKLNQQKGRYGVPDSYLKARSKLMALSGKAAKFENSRLEAIDNKAMRKAYLSSFYKLAEKNGLNKLEVGSEEYNKVYNHCVSRAIEHAWEITYREANVLTEALNKAANAVTDPDANALQKAKGLATDVVFPFRKATVNSLKQSIQYTPANLIYGGVKLRQALEAGDHDAINKAVDNLAKGATGATVCMLGYVLQKTTGAFTTISNSVTDKLKKADGQQDFSVEIGNHSITLDWMTPTASALFAGVDVCNMLDENSDLQNLGITDKFSIFVSRMIEPTLETSMLSGINNSLKSLQYNYTDESKNTSVAVRLATSLAENFISSWIPAGLARLAKGLDTSDRQLSSDNYFADSLRYKAGLGGEVGAKLGFEELGEKTNAWGDLKHENKEGVGLNLSTAGKLAYNLLSPANIEEVTHKETDQKLINLYNKAIKDGVSTQTAAGILPSASYSKTFKYGNLNSKNVEMTSKELSIYNQARSSKQSGKDAMETVLHTAVFNRDESMSKAEMARLVKKAEGHNTEWVLKWMMGTSYWKNASTSDRAKAVTNILNNSSTRGNVKTAQRAVVKAQGGSTLNYDFKTTLTAAQQKNFAKYTKGFSKSELKEAKKAMLDAVSYDGAGKMYYSSEDGTMYFGYNKAELYAYLGKKGYSEKINAAVFNSLKRWNAKEYGSSSGSGRSYGHRSGSGGSGAKVSGPKASAYTVKTYKPETSSSSSSSSSKSTAKTLKSALEAMEKAQSKITPPKNK